MTYAKYISKTEIEYLPKSIKYNGTYYSPIPDVIRDELGYLPVEETEAPVTNEGYHAEYEWKVENNTLVRIWNIVEDSAEVICVRLREYLNETDKYFIQWQEGDKTAEEYEPYRVARQAAREKIRELENE